MLSTSAPDTQVVLRYGKANGWLDGKPAVISRKVGKGSITYVGALVDDGVMKGLIDTALADARVSREFAVPENVELMTREGQGKRIVILVNHSRERREVALPAAMTDLLAGGKVSKVTLSSEGVAVLRR